MDPGPDQDRRLDAAVAIVIPNWNGLVHLPSCLTAIANQTLQPTEVVVVDNGSTDGSVAFVREHYPWVRVIEFGENKGFPAAVNAGIRSTTARYIALLNNDTRADRSWLAHLVHGLEAVPEADFAASMLVRFDAPERIDSAGHGFSLLRAKGTDLGRDRPSRDFARFAWVFGASAGAALYRRSLFEHIGLFDEDFFFSYEDVDIDVRAQAAGHRCLYVPTAVVEHYRGASHDASAPSFRAMAIRNRLWVIGKTLPLPLLAIALAGFAALGAREVLADGRRLLTALGTGVSSADVDTSSRRRLWSETWHAARTLPAKRCATRSYRRLRSRKLMQAMRSQPLEASGVTEHLTAGQ